MARKVEKIPQLSPGSGVNLGLLAMAADIPGERVSAEMMADAAEDLTAHGYIAEALDWFARIVEGGEPELAPHAALRIGTLLVDEDMDAAQAALRHAADHGRGQVTTVAAGNIRALAQHGVAPRPVPATAEEVVGRAAIGRGRIWLAQGEPGPAAAAFEQATTCRVPEVSVGGLYHLGSVRALQGDQDGARESLERAMASGHPRFAPMAAFDLSSVLLAGGEVDRAVDLLRRARAGQGWAADMAGVNLGLVLARQQGEVEAGVLELRRVAAGAEPRVAAYALFNLGALLEDGGELAGARDAYEGAMALNEPEHSGKSAVNLGIMLYRQGDLVAAGRAWRVAAERGGPDDRAKARRMLDELAGLGDLDELQSVIKHMDLTDPEVVAIGALEAGRRFLEQQDLGGALGAFEKAMGTGHPRHAAQAAAQIALMFWYQHGMAGAETAVARLGEVGFPGLVPRAWVLFGAILVRTGSFDQAGAAWRRVPESAADAQPLAACALWILHGDLANAEAAFRHALTHAADFTEDIVSTALDLGDVQAKNGNRAAAHHAYRIGLRLAELTGVPELVTQAREALGKL
ncbi:hypothetical protein [Rugosimonospora africana]|uniref:Tetratricopeptide repeat protein n=1 Tax=Rugosimonospora africana TaxID=556532 RepID=A0A8J3QUN1_9ACTN|nr:hypothetical protein [Rugosimonospora africana]GIH16799.1 hypothetical protein Raf01_49710 [Rugosimonospora africana]